MPKRLTYEQVKEYIESFEGYELLSTEYSRNSEELKIKCPNNHIYYQSFNAFKSGSRCKQCANDKLRIEKQTPVSEIYKFVKTNNYEFIKWDEEYKNQKSKFTVKCPNGHLTSVSFGNIKSHGLHCLHCAGQTKPTIEFIYSEFSKREYILITTEYKNANQKLKYLCKKHLDKGILEISWTKFRYNRGCKYCASDKFKGKNNPMWKGGVTSISDFLRDYITEWKYESMKHCNFKCILIGSDNFVIHHLHSFSDIVKEVFQITDFEIKKTISDYSLNELEVLKNTCIDLHRKYPLGICIAPPIHDLFHKLYGFGNATCEQFYEFVRRFNAGEFNNILKEYNLLNHNINITIGEGDIFENFY